jgi:hypothetical protein
MYSVRIDMALARRYGIRLQELPLLCHAILDTNPENTRALTYTEADMSQFAATAAARDRAAKNRKPPRRPANETLGAAWRVPPPPTA